MQMNRLILLLCLLSVLLAGIVYPRRDSVFASNEQDRGIYVRRFVAPRYPPLARQGLVQGGVRATVHITSTGVVESISDVTGPELLKYESIEALRKWEFSVQGNQPTKLQFTLEFVLEGPEALENRIYEVSGTLPGFLKIKTNPTTEKPSPNVTPNPR
jgi:hypothetical protein